LPQSGYEETSEMPKVSVIIVNHNGQGLITPCLHAITRQSFRDFEIIVVDNGSTDGSLAEVKKTLEAFPQSRVRVVPLGKNLGFAGGNLEGLRLASGEYIALLNNDTEADERWLEELVRAVDGHPEVGICASTLLVQGTEVIDSAGIMYATSLKGFNRGEGESRAKYQEEEHVFGACAGAALYRKRMIEEVGFLDVDFFLIHEDVDLSFRAQLAGWKVLYTPAAIVYHKVRSSIGRMSDLAVYYTLRNVEFVRIKNVPTMLLLRCLPQMLTGAVVEFAYFAVKHRHLWIYLKAKLDVLMEVSEMFRKRRVIMRTRKVSLQYLAGLLSPLLEKDFLQTKFRKFLNA
jgi:GT2 family glycosyltransferase